MAEKFDALFLHLSMVSMYTQSYSVGYLNGLMFIGIGRIDFLKWQ